MGSAKRGDTSVAKSGKPINVVHMSSTFAPSLTTTIIFRCLGSHDCYRKKRSSFANGRTYEKQYGGRFVRHLAYHQVEESWYRELSQNAILRVHMSLCLAYALVKNQALGLD